jgi:hypothetical protein
MWAIALSFVLLGGQILGVVGTTLELVYGIDAAKETELRALGFDPKFGVSINLAFSLAAVSVLALALLRARRSFVGGEAKQEDHGRRRRADEKADGL